MASSSKTTFAPLTARHCKYDVFLSFRGPDTRRGITSEIYNGLQNRDIKCFKDDTDLEVGDPISPTLLTAIEESKFAIVVLSPNYARSTWCLEELVKICQFMDNKSILPLFYDVNPADVKYQKETFEVAFAKHEKSGRYKSEEVQQWRDALNMVASFSGWHTQNYKTDKELVEAIVYSLCTKVQPTAFQSTGDFIVFDSTRQAMDQVMKALKDNELTVVAVYGMGGAGKTTLVNHIGEEARKQGLFDHVIMVRVNQTPDLKTIQGMLADGLGITIKKETEDGRASTLSSEIMRRNKILIILDNVWENIDLPSIGIPSYDMLQKCNSKVLLTTRIWNVCHVMRSQVNITLNSLSEEDSWTLFVKYARKSFDSSDFEDIARKVASECGGLPIALIAVARALGDKDLSDWEQAADQLKKSKAANLDHTGDATECIKLSYDFLKDGDTKSCFLLCCLFPEDCDIEVEDLFRYAVGKGLFRDADTIQEARKRVVSVVKHLKHSSLLCNSEYDGCTRMHDVVRDTAIQITQSADEPRFLVNPSCGLKNWPSRLHEGYSAISLMKNDIRQLPEEWVCPDLQILLIQENGDLDNIPDTFFKNTSELRVVDLSLTSISSLSKSFIHLSNLQGLYLDSCQKLSDMSILKNFKKLEILSMKQYPLNELSTELGNLTNLRVLDVTGESLVGGVVIIPPEVISKLQKLEELWLHCGFWDWGSKVEGAGETNNVSFDELTSLSYLYSLKICISDASCIPKGVRDNPSWTCFDICIGKDMNTRNTISGLHNQFFPNDPKYSKSLVLDTTISMLPAWFVSAVTRNTEKLMYVNFTGVKNILMEYHLGRLSCLKHLSLIGPKESLEALILVDTRTSRNRTKPVFEKLEELYLVSMDSLEELCSGELPSRSLLNLKVLEVRDCPDLGNVLLPAKLLQRLANLENLSCHGMPGMEYVFGFEGYELAQSKLREMKLSDLDAIKSICYGPAPPAVFQALNSLFIYQCNLQGGLFTYEAAQCLSQLQQISIERCPNLESVVEASKESPFTKKAVLPKLESLLFVDLPVLYSGSDAVDMECPSLQQLYVRNCPHLSACADDFASMNQVKLNDPLQYVQGYGTRLGKVLNTVGTYSKFKAMNIFGTSMRNLMLLHHKQLLKTPLMMEWVAELLPDMSKTVEMIPKVLEKMPEPLLKKMMPEIMQVMPEIMQVMPEIMDIQNGPGNKLELLKTVPEIMQVMPEIMDIQNGPGNKLELLKTVPSNILPEMMYQSVEQLIRFMETMPEMMESLPDFIQKIRDIDQSTDPSRMVLETTRVEELIGKLLEKYVDTEDLLNKLKSFFSGP